MTNEKVSTDLFGFPIQPTQDVSTIQKRRLIEYKEEHCFQYDVRLKNYEEDVFYSGLSKDELDSLSAKDFSFLVAVDERDRIACREFIKRHEWLGTIPQYTTHYFFAKYKGIIAGVILMGVPNSFSKILGDGSDKLERLISRGACISWSPKNLASHFLMWCIKWMVINTEYRVFTAYSDPSARELGSIYQACNFYYLGQKYGTTTRYINPFNNKICSDRFFRQRSAYKKYAQMLGIRWEINWDKDGRINWDVVPNDIELKLRDKSKEIQTSSQKVLYAPKHKYAFVLGKDKRETRHLRDLFLLNTKVYDYPKERGL